MHPFIYLASQSPRRSQLLAQLGVAHQLLLANTDGDIFEDAEALETVRHNEAPLTYVQRVTQLKLAAALARLERRGWAHAPVLCADTVVAKGRCLFGKPADAEDAAQMLRQLSGSSHRVITAVGLGYAQQKSLVCSVSRVTFADLSEAQIDRYVASGEPFGKAGAYGIQGAAAAFISHISGSYSGVMGLPLFETAKLLSDIEFLNA